LSANGAAAAVFRDVRSGLARSREKVAGEAGRARMLHIRLEMREGLQSMAGNDGDGHESADSHHVPRSVEYGNTFVLCANANIANIQPKG
jgi:hypothetical protein